MVSQSKGTEIARPEISRDALADVNSLDDALEFFRQQGVELAEAADILGDGFAVQKDKNALVDVPFLILKRDEKLGDYGPFSIVYAMTGDGRKFVITDGSTGIHQQLAEVEKKRPVLNVMCRKGLTRSDYTYTDAKGDEKPATTYYINTEAA